MRRDACMATALLVVTACVAATPTDEVSKGDLFIVRYCVEPLRTFRIDGTDIEGISLAGLPDALVEHRSAHPGGRYEVLSEVKSTPETVSEIRVAFEEAGLSIEHFWVPVSDAGGAVGPHGPGYVDAGR